MLTRREIDRVGLFGAFALALLPALFTFSPILRAPSVSARTRASNTSATADSDVNVVVKAVLSLAATDVAIGAIPAPDSPVFTTGSGTVSVSTDSPGYTVQISTEDDTLAGDTVDIPSIESEQTGSAMLADSSLPNSWGFINEAVSGTQGSSADLSKSFYPIPELATLSESAYYYPDYTGAETITVSYGVKVAPTLPPGDYVRTVTFTAVNSALSSHRVDFDRHTIFDLTNMQDMLLYPSACDNTPTPSTEATVNVSSLSDYSIHETGIDRVPTAVLIDTRDGNEYVVKKLADGNCWMISNLRINKEDLLSYGTTALTATNTDVTTDFDVSALPNTASISGTTVTGFPNSYSNSEIAYAGSNATVVNKDNYLYNWHAAILAPEGVTVNGPNNSIYATGQNAPNSLCPAGWQLPVDVGEKSWSGLFVGSEGGYDIANPSTNKYVSGNVNQLTVNPFRLSYTGRILDNTLQAGNTNGYFWTSTSSSNTNAGHLGFTTNDIYVHGSRNKRYGASIRCVAK